ncbi:MAG: PAS domain S-box protein, partial [Myxococcota bacterium]
MESDIAATLKDLVGGSDDADLKAGMSRDDRADLHRHLTFVNIGRIRILAVLLGLNNIAILVLMIFGKVYWDQEAAARLKLDWIPPIVTALMAIELVLCIAFLAVVRKPATERDVRKWHVLGAFGMIMAVCVLISMRAAFIYPISGSMEDFLLAVIGVAAVLLMTLPESLAVFISSELVLVAITGMIDFQFNTTKTLLNSLVTGVLAFIISQVLFRKERRDFLRKKLVDRTTERLRESEETFRQLFDNAPIGIFRTTTGGNVLQANPALLRILGLESLDDLNNTGLINIYTCPGDRNRLLEKVKNGVVAGFETQFRRADGQTIPVCIGAYMVRDEKGRPEYLEGTLEDITERKRAEEALKESEERFSQVVNRAQVGVFRTNLEGLILLANPAALGMFGYKTIESFNEKGGIPGHYVNPADRGRLIAELQKGPVSSMEIPLHREDGGVVYLEVSAKLIRDTQERPPYLEGTLVDVTERNRMQAALRESEEQYHALFESSRDAIMMGDLHGTVDCNRAALELFGYSSKEEFIRRPISALSPPAQPDGSDSLKLSLRRLKAAMSEGSQFFEWTHMKADGTRFPAEVALNRMEFHGRTMIQGVVREITERKRVEEELKESGRRLTDIISFLPLPTMVIDRSGRVTAWNRAM